MSMNDEELEEYDFGCNFCVENESSMNTTHVKKEKEEVGLLNVFLF